MEVIELVEDMRIICTQLQRQGRRIALVPTSGALHQGQVALIERANSLGRPECKRAVIVSIFAHQNQGKSGPESPNCHKTLANDLRVCRESGLRVDYVFVPKHEQMFPKQFEAQEQEVDHNQEAGCQIKVACSTSALANQLEARSRPASGHFEPMLTSVCKLLQIIQPQWALFGERDYQQLRLVATMVEDLSMATVVCPVPIVREPDTNLPLSAQNKRLTRQQRQAARVMFDILTSSRQAIEQRCSQRCAPSVRRALKRCDVAATKAASALAQLADLETVLLGARLVAQSLSETTDELKQVEGEHSWPPEGQRPTVNIEYLELRCANDLTVIRFDEQLELYDCQLNCLKRRLARTTSQTLEQDNEQLLEARLLIAIVVGKVRLTDNMQVHLNL